MRTDTITGRFATAYADDQLYELVKTVALLVNPIAPAALTEQQFDACRAGAGHPDAPSARQITSRLQLGWRPLIELVLTGDRSLARSHDARTREPQRAFQDERYARYALRRACLELRRETISELEYTTVRDDLVARDPSPDRLLVELLPTASRILTIHKGNWSNALEAAGLPRFKQQQTRGLEVPKAISLFIDHTGLLPHREHLRNFAKHHGLSVKTQTGSWTENLEEMRRFRDERGLKTPFEFASSDLAFTGTAAGKKVAGPARRNRYRWTNKNACLQGIATFIGTLPPDSRPTAKAYQAWQIGRRNYPPLRSLQRHGRWQVLVEQARELTGSNTTGGARAAN
jgi:hypothetical protein